MNPSNEGQDLTNVKTKDGIVLGKLMVEKGTSSGGSFSYMWENPKTKTVEKKISYEVLDPNWGWIVGSGAYLSEFNQGANQVLYILLINLGVSLLIGAILVWLFANRITNPIIKMANEAKRVAEGDLTVEVINVKTKDEIGQLTKAFNTSSRWYRDRQHSR